MAEGTVRWFNPQKGFGFIAADEGGDVFVHHTAVQEGKSLGEGQRVSFEVQDDPKGKKAVNVVPKDEFVDVPPSDRPKRERGRGGFGGGGGYGGGGGGGFRGGRGGRGGGDKGWRGNSKDFRRRY